MKRYKAYLPIAVIILLLALLALCRGKMTDYISTRMAAGMERERKELIRNTLSDRYDYDKNGQPYRGTFLEFGSTGCHACRQMESVMAHIKSRYSHEVNVVFVNVAQKENRDLVNYYGISIIPTQILLDRNGQEHFRHSGYLSANDLSEHLTKIIILKKKSNE